MTTNSVFSTITTARGISYEIQRISAAPIRYVAFVQSPGLDPQPIHRDGRDLFGVFQAVAQHIDGTEASLQTVDSMMARIFGGQNGAH